MPEKIRKKQNAVYWLAVLFCVAFLISSIFFMRYAQGQNERETQSYMQEIAEQSKATIDKQVSGDFQTLDGVAEMIGSMEELDVDALLPTLEQINNENVFLRMGIADRSGRVAGVDLEGNYYHDVDLSDRGFIERAFAGENVITDTLKAKTGDYYVNYYAVPIEKNGEVIAVLCAVSSADVLGEIVDTSIFGGKGFAHIIDSDGDYVIRSQHPTVSQDAVNIYEHYSFTAEEAEQLKNDLANGRGGFISYPYGDEERWAAYTPTGINDWFAFCIVPEEEINQNFTIMSRGVIGIVAGAVLIFLFFLVHIKRANDRKSRELEEIAFTDELTGYRNYRKFLTDAAEILKHRKERYAVLYFDLKNFKYVNDLFGYDMGDRLLRHWSDMLNASMDEGEIFARISADNFVSLRKYQTKDDLERRFRDAVEFLQNYPEVRKQGLKIGLCLGIYLTDEGDDALSINDMIDRANVAQKSVKGESGSRFAYYSREMRDKVLQETELETRMEEALQNGEFELYFQPKIDIQRRTVAGAEALARWNIPGKGLIPPGEFIPLFERNGFIVKLDQYMLEQTCKKYREHMREGRHFVISVNVSRLCILQADFVETYTSVKNQYGIPDGAIELEFTESVVFENHELFREIVTVCQENGFLCSLDDFGSGHSSLNILKDLPVDIIKLDRLFFLEGMGQDQARDRRLVESIVQMARALEMKTVAEGVEAMEQVEFLREIGCDMVQGFVFSRPLPEEEFLRFIERWKEGNR